MESGYNGKMIRKQILRAWEHSRKNLLEREKTNFWAYLVRAALPTLIKPGRCEPCGKKTCLVYNSIRTTTTFTTEACENSERSFKLCGEAPYVGKAKTKFRYRFNNYKSNHRAFRKGNRKIPLKCFCDHYCVDGHLGIHDWDLVFEQCETHKQLKGRETFWQHQLKIFYPLGLNEKEDYLF